MYYDYMASIETQCQSLLESKPKKIRGVVVERDGDQYFIDGENYNLQGAVGIIKESGSLSRRKFPYSQVVFLLVKPPSHVVSTHQIRNRSEHSKLLERAKTKNYFVYHADVQKQEDGKFCAIPPWIIDWESVDNIYGPPENLGKAKSRPKTVANVEEVEYKTELSCPFCGKKVNSTPGRTLHVKTKHPDRYEEYMETK